MEIQESILMPPAKPAVGRFGDSAVQPHMGITAVAGQRRGWGQIHWFADPFSVHLTDPVQVSNRGTPDLQQVHEVVAAPKEDAPHLDSGVRFLLPGDRGIAERIQIAGFIPVDLSLRQRLAPAVHDAGGVAGRLLVPGVVEPDAVSGGSQVRQPGSPVGENPGS